MKKITRLIAAALLVLPLACTEGLDGLKERVDDLDSRVTSLEVSIKALNANVEALSVLAGGATINSVVEKDGTYTITLTNGDDIVIRQGAIGVGFAPIMTIDEHGYWMADYQDGKGSVPVVDAAGKQVSAKGENGKTPQFSVDSEGYWTVSYDSVNYERVLDADKKPVKAIASEGSDSDSYFKGVKIEDDTLVLTLRNGETYSVPVVKDFLVSIKEADNIVVFKSGEEKSFVVEMKGVAQSVLSAPTGWTASLSEAMLTVKAPEITKATVADLGTDVSILAISAKGYSAVAKVRVQLDGQASAGTPKASVTAGTIGYNSINFTVVTENCTSWKYMLAKSSDPVPGAATLLSSGTEGTSGTLEIGGLSELTGYVLYVLPVNGENLGTVASCSVTTIAEPIVEYEDNYTAYNEGKAIVIAGVKYDKATCGEAVLLSATTADTDLRASINDKGGVFFLEEADGFHFMAPAGAQVQITKDVLVISRYTSKPVTYKPATYHQLRKAATLAMKNVIIDMSALPGTYFCNFGAVGDGGPFKNLHFDGCQFLTGTNKQLMYASAQELVNSIRLYNCYVESTKDERMDFIALAGNVYLDNLKEIVLYNNIFYNADPKGALGIISSSGAATKSGNPQETDIVLKQNTFYGVAGSNCYFTVRGAKSLTIQNNLFYATSGQTTHTFVLKTVAEGDVNCTISDNIGFSASGKNNFDYTHSNSKYIYSGEETTAPKAASDPLIDADPAHGDFSVTSAYAAYGAKR